MPGSSIVSTLQPLPSTLLLPHLYIPRNSTENKEFVVAQDYQRWLAVEAWKPRVGSLGMEGLPSSGFYIHTTLHVLLELDILGY